MSKSYLIRLTFVLFFLLIFYPIAGEPYAQIEATPVVKELVIDVPAETNAGDDITIKVSLYVNHIRSYDVEGAYLTFDYFSIGQTNKDGFINYTIPKSMMGMYRITARSTYEGVYREAVKTIQVEKYVDNKLAIQCYSDESLIRPVTKPDNFIIVIDSSGSTTSSDPTTGISFIGLINDNAIKIVQKIARGSRVGVVVFGGQSMKTEMLTMSSENDKEELEGVIRNISPKSSNAPTDLEKGLIGAEELLADVNGKKEIIVISDGNLPGENLGLIKNKTISLKNKDIKIHFIQVLMTYTLVKEANRFYDELGKFSSDGHVIVLNPGESINTFIEIAPSNVPFEEQCSTKINDTTTITVTSSGGTPVEGVRINLDNTVIGMTNRAGDFEYIFNISGFFNISTTKPGYDKAEKIIQVLPAPTTNPTATANQTPNSELLSMSIQSNETQAEIKETPGFMGGVAFFILLILAAIRREF